MYGISVYTVFAYIQYYRISSCIRRFRISSDMCIRNRGIRMNIQENTESTHLFYI